MSPISPHVHAWMKLGITAVAYCAIGGLLLWQAVSPSSEVAGAENERVLRRGLKAAGVFAISATLVYVVLQALREIL